MNRLEALLRLLALERLPRLGWVQAGVARPESVAAHSLGTALVVLALGPGVEPPLDVDRAVSLAVLHDAPEALLGDLPRSATALLPPGAKASAEARAAATLLAPLSAAAEEREAEARACATREARFVKVCDALQLGVRLVGYLREGARGLDEFRAGLQELACEEFGPCEELRRALLKALDAHPADGRRT